MSWLQLCLIGEARPSPQAAVRGPRRAAVWHVPAALSPPSRSLTLSSSDVYARRAQISENTKRNTPPGTSLASRHPPFGRMVSSWRSDVTVIASMSLQATWRVARSSAPQTRLPPIYAFTPSLPSLTTDWKFYSV